MKPDFSRVAESSSSIIQKDGRHTLLVFSILGIAIIIYGLFNPEYQEGLIYGGTFFLIIGVGKFLVEKYKRPYLMIARIKKKEAIPYTRIQGTFDFFVLVEAVNKYTFSSNGESESTQADLGLRIKVSAETFASLTEDEEVMILYSSTRMFLGIMTADYQFKSN